MTTASEKANKQLIHEYFDAWEERNPEAIAEFFADDFSSSYTDPTGEEVTIKAEDVQEWLAGYLGILCEYTHEIHELVAEDDWVIARITYSFVNDEEYLGIEPTGNQVDVKDYLSFRLEDGSIVELHTLADQLNLFNQIGVDTEVDRVAVQ